MSYFYLWVLHSSWWECKDARSYLVRSVPAATINFSCICFLSTAFSPYHCMTHESHTGLSNLHIMSDRRLACRRPSTWGETGRAATSMYLWVQVCTIFTVRVNELLIGAELNMVSCYIVGRFLWDLFPGLCFSIGYLSETHVHCRQPVSEEYS